MDDPRKDEVVKNGIGSVLSSPDSVLALISTDSNETSASDLLSSSAYRKMDSSTINTQSKTSLSSFSDGALSDLTPDAPVNSQTQSLTTDYSGTRFVVKRMENSELQPSTSRDSPTRGVKTPSQSPKSVKFVVDDAVAGPSKGKSPQKSPSGLSKSITTGALAKLLDLEPKKLFSPKSQDSFSSKEEIELPTINRAITSAQSNDSSDDENYFAGADLTGDRSNIPLLSDSETELANRSESLKALDVRSPDGTVSTVPVEEIPNTPEMVSSEGTLTVNDDRRIEKCILSATLWYIGFIILMMAIAGAVYLGLSHLGVFAMWFSGKAVNATLIPTNGTENTTIPFTLDGLNDPTKTSAQFSFATESLAKLEVTTTDAGRDNKDGAAQAHNTDDSTATTTTTEFAIVNVSTTVEPFTTTDATAPAETTTIHHD